MSQVLGRVIGRELDGPRGPDVAHRVRVPQDWIDEAAVIEVELPRHLHCAVCEGGGCEVTSIVRVEAVFQDGFESP